MSLEILMALVSDDTCFLILVWEDNGHIQSEVEASVCSNGVASRPLDFSLADDTESSNLVGDPD